MFFLSYGSRCEMIINFYGFGRTVSDKSHIYCAVQLKGRYPSYENIFFHLVAGTFTNITVPFSHWSSPVRGCQLHS